MDDNWGSPTKKPHMLRFTAEDNAPYRCFQANYMLILLREAGFFTGGGCTYWHECCYLLIRCLFRWFRFENSFFVSGCWLMLVDSCCCILSFIAIGCTRTVLISIAMIIHFVVCTHGRRLVIIMCIISSHIITVMYAYVAPYYIYLYIIMYTSYLDGRWLPSLLPSLCGKPVASNEVKQKKA